MDIDDELESWLQAQPLNEPVDVDGESVYLKPGPDGADAVQVISENPYRLARDIRGIGFKSTFSLGDTVELLTPTLAVAFHRTRFTVAKLHASRRHSIC